VIYLGTVSNAVDVWCCLVRNSSRYGTFLFLFWGLPRLFLDLSQKNRNCPEDGQLIIHLFSVAVGILYNQRPTPGIDM